MSATLSVFKDSDDLNIDSSDVELVFNDSSDIELEKEQIHIHSAIY